MDQGEPSRRRAPTASDRKRRAREAALLRSRIEQQVEEEEVGVEEEEQVEDMDVEVEDWIQHTLAEGADFEPEQMTAPFPGGPQVSILLESYPNHIAPAIWFNPHARQPLKCHNHTTKLHSWVWRTQPAANSTFKTHIENSKLSNLEHVSFQTCNKMVISAFVERWHPETNSFHMPFGEMTITLDDVSALLGIPIVGTSITTGGLNFEGAVELVVETLGVLHEEAKTELEHARGLSVRFSWLKTRFGNHYNDYSARAYLLYVLGCTLFSDKSGTSVPVVYLRFLKVLKTVKDHAWGASALAHLYRQLGIGSRSGNVQMSGYLTLLEAWIYEHFPFLGPNQNLDCREEHPRAFKWLPRPYSGLPVSNLILLREQLDIIHPTEVIWQPYNRTFHPFKEVAYFCGVIANLKITEPYHPDRVLRQFGRIQGIPHDPIAPSLGSNRSKNPKVYKVSYPYIEHMWDRWEDHVLALVNRGEVIEPNGYDVKWNYMGWYQHHSHILVQNPEHRLSIPQNAGVDDYNPHEPSNRISRALTISQPFVQRGREACIVDPTTLYTAIEDITQVLQEHHIDPRMYTRRRRRQGNDDGR